MERIIRNFSTSDFILVILAITIGISGFALKELYAQQNSIIESQSKKIFDNHAEVMGTFDRYVTNAVILQMMKNSEDRNNLQMLRYEEQKELELKRWNEQKDLNKEQKNLNEKILDTLHGLDTVVQILIKTKGVLND